MLPQKNFLSAFGLETLRDLPDMEALEDAGLLSKEKQVDGIPIALGLSGAVLVAEEQDDG